MPSEMRMGRESLGERQEAQSKFFEECEKIGRGYRKGACCKLDAAWDADRGHRKGTYCSAVLRGSLKGGIDESMRATELWDGFSRPRGQGERRLLQGNRDHGEGISGQVPAIRRACLSHDNSRSQERCFKTGESLGQDPAIRRARPAVERQMLIQLPGRTEIILGCAKPPELWHDMHVLTFSLVAWRWSTGMPSHPGPPDLARRVSTKRAIPDCPPPALHMQEATADTQWFNIEEDNEQEQAPPWCTEHGLFLESKNVTSLLTHEVGMARRQARLSLVQEHSLPAYELKQMKFRYKHDHERQLVASPTDHNNPRSAGVAAIARSCDTLFEFKPIESAFQKFRDCGRAIHLGFGMGRHGKVLSIFNVYGHSGGALDPKKARLTSAILQACMAEARHYADHPTLLVGDLNGDFDTFDELGTLVSTMGWQDLNTIANTWGQPSNQPTCRTALSKLPTIRDYCLACPLALPLIRGFRVLDADLCPVHSTMQIQIDLKTEDRWVHHSVPKRPLRELLDQAFVHRFGTGPLPPPDDLQQDLEQLSEGHALPPEFATPEMMVKQTPFVRSYASSVYKEAKATFAQQQETFMGSAKKHMDLSLATIAPKLRRALTARNTTLFWQTFWDTIETATLAFTADAHDMQDVKIFKGRGSTPVNLVKQKTPRVNQSRDGSTMHSPDWLATVQHHVNRCKFIADNLAILAKDRINASTRSDILNKVEACKTKVFRFLDWQISHSDLMHTPNEGVTATANMEQARATAATRLDPQSLKSKLEDPATSLYAGHFALKKEIKKYDAFIGAWQRLFANQLQQQSKERLKNLQSKMGAMCNVLKGSSSAPITRIKIDSDNSSSQATFTTDPAIIDQQLQGIWGKIHMGNLGPASQKDAGRFFTEKYGCHMVSQDEFKIPDLTTEHLKEAIQNMPDNAPGLDGVQEGDMAVLSDGALDWLVAMLTCIEDGAPWPSQTLVGRTAWLDKTEGPEPSTDPLDYRGLAILSKVYRLYGVIRLRHLHPWINTWEYPELFAGTTAPSGAEDAWFLLGVDFELARLTGQPFTGGSADIWKCFDQVQRALLYWLLQVAGFPMQILNAYRSFHEAVQYHNTIGTALGAPHAKPCSIPQGCPFSMMMTGFSFHPWVALMRTMGVKPRGLADDLTIVAFGPDHERRFRDAFVATMHYLNALGAKPAPNKCFTFSSLPDTRIRLGEFYWQALQAKVKVVNDCRDLGAHLSVTARLKGATLTSRIHRATILATKLACYPWGWEAKRRVVDTLILPLALYGVEAVPAPDYALAKLDVAIAKAIGPYSQNSSVALATLLAAPNRNLSTSFTVLWRSCALLRRMLTKHPQIVHKVGIIFGIYLQMSKPGVIQEQADAPPSQPAPPPGHGSRARWNNASTDKGPIGLLISRVHCMGASISADFIIQVAPYLKFDMFNCAHQYLRKHLEDIAAQALSTSISASRTMYNHCGVIDATLYHRCFRKVEESLKPGLLRLQLQAHWSDAQQERFYHTQRGAICPHCKVKASSILHLWECEGLSAYRKSLDDEIAELNPSNTPHHLLMGIPELFDAGDTGDFCSGAANGSLGSITLHNLLLHKVDLPVDLERAIRSHAGDDRGFNHQQLAYKVLATTGHTALQDTVAITDVAPSKPSVATDGGLKHAGRGMAFGTFGTWEPGREWAQITPEELTFARPLGDRFLPRPSGIMLAGIIPGVFNSSSRAELAGLISALAKPIGIHIALDNKSVADRARAIIEGTCQSRRPWRLRPDGDLWQLVAQLIASRGEGTTKVSWTKGHAGWQWIARQSDNATTVANGQADYAANCGTAAIGRCSDVAVLDFHAVKLKEYESLVLKLQVHAANLIQHDKDLRQQRGILNEGKMQPAKIISEPIQQSRPCFEEGIPLCLNSLPPACAIHDISENTSSILTNMTSIHMFWASLRWKVDHQARPTTWLELFALFRIMGGGPRETDPHISMRSTSGLKGLKGRQTEHVQFQGKDIPSLLHMPRLPFMPSIKAFIKASKALFKLVAEGEALELLRAAKGKSFRLNSYGLEVHLPAVRAEVCLSDGMATQLHRMLCRIRLIKQGIHKGSLKASAAPLPKKEPWADLLASAPTPIITLMDNRKARRLDNISTRGERGDNRELKPLSLILVCPTCATPRDCAQVRLFTNIARGLSCSNCKKSTSSTRWCCSHGTSWTSCPFHREAGFRCGAHSLLQTKANFKGSRWTDSLKAIKRKQAKLSRIGSLGEPKRLPLSSLNSVRTTTTVSRTMVRKKKIKRRGSPTQRGKSSRRGPEPVHATIKPQCIDTRLEFGKDSCTSNDHERQTTTSIYWLAHSRQPRGSTSSNNNSYHHPIHYEAGSFGEPRRPAKIARLCAPFSKQAQACKGNCPEIWTIESYCELCHS
jgi:hypothetical protein